MKLLPPLLLSLSCSAALGVAAGDDKKDQPRSAHPQAPESLSVAKPPAGSAAASTTDGGSAPVHMSPEPASTIPAPVLLKERAPRAAKAAAPSPTSALPALRAHWTRDGQAALVVDGMEQTVRAGSWIGAMEVKSLAPGRMVLEKAAMPGDSGGEALVIVTFDASGKSRAVTLYTQDPRPVVSPEVHK